MVITATACGPKVPKSLQQGPEAKLVAIQDDAALKLEGGAIARLAALDFPNGAEAAIARLRQAALGRAVRLYFDGAVRDARGAYTAQIYARDEAGQWRWLQRDLVEAGLARVTPQATDGIGVQALLSFEAEARAAGKGLWTDPDFAVRPANAEDLSKDIGGFVLVEGRVVSAGRASQRVFLNFGDDYKTDFTVTIPEDAWSAWPGGAPYLLNLKGEKVRVRGVLTKRNGPSVEALSPAQIEDLGPA